MAVGPVATPLFREGGHVEHPITGAGLAEHSLAPLMKPPSSRMAPFLGSPSSAHLPAMRRAPSLLSASPRRSPSGSGTYGLSVHGPPTKGAPFLLHFPSLLKMPSWGPAAAHVALQAAPAHPGGNGFIPDPQAPHGGGKEARIVLGHHRKVAAADAPDAARGRPYVSPLEEIAAGVVG